MQVLYEKLFALLKERHIPQQRFITQCGISGSSMTRLRNNQNVTTDVICRICDNLSVHPSEIMEWLTDEEYAERLQEQTNAEKQALEAQIAELQAKLKKL